MVIVMGFNSLCNFSDISGDFSEIVRRQFTRLCIGSVISMLSDFLFANKLAIHSDNTRIPFLSDSSRARSAKRLASVFRTNGDSKSNNMLN